ncbi:unnamed protein product [Prunus armeniaca]
MVKASEFSEGQDEEEDDARTVESDPGFKIGSLIYQRNPADFNGYMIRGEDLKFGKRIPFSRRHGLVKGKLFQEKAREVDEESNEMILRTSAMTWAMAELARKPKPMKKAQEEVRRCVGNKGNISEQYTNELQYVKMIVKDTRLHPPAPIIIPRENMAHFKIQDYDIDPKTLVFVNG